MLILAVTWTLLVTYHVKSYEEGSGRNTFFTECGKTQTYKKDGISCKWIASFFQERILALCEL